MKQFSYAKQPKYAPGLDPLYRPMAPANREYLDAVKKSGGGEKVKIALLRSSGLVSVHETRVFGESCGKKEDNLIYIERLVKTLLWLKGGYKIIFSGPRYIFEHLKNEYRMGGAREFDVITMSKVYENPFEVVPAGEADFPQEKESACSVGRHLEGCRIGFDAGGSDRKVSAVIDGEPVYSEEVVWHPKLNSDPSYQYNGILDSMKTAAAKMPRVDAIGVSAAGIYIEGKVMAASLFIKVPEDVFEKKVKNLFFDIQKEMGGVPIEVANDGDVTALAGAMSLGADRVLGIAMGTSEAAGYVDAKGNITGWLNELAFVPVDYSTEAMEDEWSGDIGCGVKYFSQDGVIKLAPAAGIKLDESLSPADKLKAVQKLMAGGDSRAKKIYDSIGRYLGYAIAYYAGFYDIAHVLLLGRVTSGAGGDILLETARHVIDEEFPELLGKINIIIPDEKSRRVGQSVAAASLPEIV
jgi:predicted NBD/HSP70 family sugar kinase